MKGIRVVLLKDGEEEIYLEKVRIDNIYLVIDSKICYNEMVKGSLDGL